MIIRSRAPLRLGLAGGGTDVSPYCDQFGGAVLNVTIDLYAYTIIEPTDNGRVRFTAADIDGEYEAAADEAMEIGYPLILHRAVYRRIVRDFNGGKPLPCHITTFCDAPPGSGLGTSSTMVVSLVKAFVEWLNLPLGEYEIAHLAFEIERIDADMSGGKQDQYAAAFGGFNFMEFYRDDRVIVNPLRIKNWMISELESSIVLYYTGVSRSSATIINEQIKSVKAGNTTAIDAMHELKRESVVMKEALLRGDVPLLVRSFAQSWEAKKSIAHNVTNSHIDSVYSVAMKAGAKAAKISGAGGGGFMMFLVDPTRRMDVIRALNETGGQTMSCQFTKYGTQGWRIG